MSGIFGKPAAAAIPTQLNAINVDQSRYGDPVPLVYGVQRIPMTLLWYGAFSSSAQYNSSGKGGKGPPSSYSYTASCVMGLCEGPIAAIRTVWKDKDLTTLAAEGLTAFLGAGGQAPWSYLTSNFPSEAVPYDHTAYLAEANLALGGSAALPNYTFEVQGFLSLPGTAITFTSGIAANGYTATVSGASPVADGIWDVTFSDGESRTATFLTTSGITAVSWDSTLGLVNAVTASAIVGGFDARLDTVLVDYCTDVNHGAMFVNAQGVSYLNTSQIQGHTWISGGTTYYDSFAVYCLANGIFASPWEDTQRPASDFVKDLFAMGNSDCVVSAGIMNVVPYGDTPISGNGVTYTPNLQPLFSFTDDDFLPNNEGQNNDPVIVIRKPLTETYNVVRVEFLDRGNAYNPSLAQWEDPLDIAVNGIRVMPNKSFHQICDARVAGAVAALIGQRQLYVRNTYQFSVRADYSILEPMDLVAITDSNLGISNLLVRITETQDDENDVFTITAEDCLVGVASAPKYNFQMAQGYAANFNTPPFMAAAPVIFSVPAALVGAGGGYELGIAVGPGTTVYGGGTNGDWGGCDVFASLDTVTYTFIGRVQGAARYGTIPNNITTTASSIDVTLTVGAQALGLQLSSASASDFANNRALIYCDGEIMGFETVTLIGTGEYSLSVSRGLFGTGPSPGVGLAHTAGASWCRLDEAMLYFDFDPGMVGQTLDLKFTSFNSVGRAEQPQSEATAYSYLIELQNGNQLIGGQLTLLGSGMGINGNAVFKSANTSAFDSGAWSLQGYTSGAFVTFSPTDTSSQAVMGLFPANGLQSALTGSNDYAFYCDAGTLYANENGVNSSSLGSYSAGDVLTIIYDGKSIAYTQNGTQLRKITAASGLTFYLNSLFETYQDKFKAIIFGPYGASTPVIWATRGNAIASDSLIFKNGGASTWANDDVYSIDSYPTCNIVWKANDTTGVFLVGFLTAVPASPAFAAAEYAIDCNAGSYRIYESGAYTGITGAYTSQDRFSITYDGTTITYALNGVTLRAPTDPGVTFFAYIDLYTPGTGLNSADFGPGSIVPIIDTGEIGDNAASQIASAVVSGSTGYNIHTGAVNANPISVTLTATGQPIGIDVSTEVIVDTDGAAFVSPMTASITRDGTVVGTAEFDLYNYVTSTQPFGSGPVYGWSYQLALIVNDSPAAGSHTYALNFNSAQASGGTSAGVQFINSIIKVREYKR